MVANTPKPNNKLFNVGFQKTKLENIDNQVVSFFYSQVINRLFFTDLFNRFIYKINFILMFTVFFFVVSNRTLCERDTQND